MIVFFLKRRVTTLVVFAALILFGGISLKNLKLELLPDISFPTLTIITFYENVSPGEIETLVTRPIEEMVSSVAGVERVSSESLEGVSLITVRFRWGTDMDQASIQAREKADLVKGSLPQDVRKSIVLRFDPNNAPLMQLAVEPRRISLKKMRSYLKKNVRPFFERIEGVAAISVSGGFQRQVLVNIDGGRLRAYDADFSEVITRIRAGNFNFPAGNIKRGDREILVRTIGEYKTVKLIGDTVIGATESGVPIYLRNLAEVKDGFRERTSMSYHDGVECVGLTIKKETGKNTVAVAERTRKIVALVNEKFGKDLRLHIVSDGSLFVRNSIRDVAVAGLLAVIVCYGVLLFFLGDVRMPLIVLASIPVSVMSTFLLMFMQGLTLNTMSLGGLAVGVGMMVDSSTVVLESIYESRRREPDVVKAAVLGTGTVAGSVISSTMTSCVVFLPVVFLDGMAGALFGELSLTITYSLLSSMAVSLTLLPVLSTIPFFATQAREPNRFGLLRAYALERITSLYACGLRYTFLHRRLLFAGTAGVIGLTVLIFRLLPAELMPDMDQGRVTLSIIRPEGATLKDTSRMLRRLVETLREDSRVERTFARAGYEERDLAINPRADFGLNRGSISIVLKAGESTVDFIARSRKRMAEIAQQTHLEFAASRSVSAELLGPRAAGMSIEVSGRDLKGIRRICDELKKALSRKKYLRDISTSFRDEKSEYRIELDRDKMAFFGITVRDAAVTLKAALKGEVATKFRNRDEEIDVLVRLREADRRGLPGLRAIAVRPPGAKAVTLSAFARIKFGKSPRKIIRIEGKRVGIVWANFSGVKQSRVFEDLRPLLAAYDREREFSVLTGDLDRRTRNSFRALLFAGMLALVLVYMVLASQFENLLLPVVVMLSIVVVGFGSGLFLLLTNHTLNTISVMGLVMLAGLVVNNAIVLIEFFQQNMDSRKEVVLEELAVRSVRRRMNPILNTTATTMLGLLPMAIPFAGTSPQAPMALCVIGGLLVSTIFTLVLIPNICVIVFRRKGA